MGMIGFHVLFPDEAKDECRTVMPLSHERIPERTFLFVEAYCAEPGCDCRRVLINIAKAPADAKTREGWLDRLWEAHANDEIPYIETLADYWGELCGSKEIASAWADRLVGMTRMALSPDKDLRGWFHGTSACLSALFHAGRYAEIVDLLRADDIRFYEPWADRALAAMGKQRAQTPEQPPRSR